MDGRRVDLREPNDHLPMITILFIIVCVAAILLYGEKQKEKKQQKPEPPKTLEQPKTPKMPSNVIWEDSSRRLSFEPDGLTLRYHGSTYRFSGDGHEPMVIILKAGEAVAYIHNAFDMEYECGQFRKNPDYLCTSITGRNHDAKHFCLLLTTAIDDGYEWQIDDLERVVDEKTRFATREVWYCKDGIEFGRYGDEEGGREQYHYEHEILYIIVDGHKYILNDNVNEPNALYLFYPGGYGRRHAVLRIHGTNGAVLAAYADDWKSGKPFTPFGFPCDTGTFCEMLAYALRSGKKDFNLRELEKAFTHKDEPRKDEGITIYEDDEVRRKKMDEESARKEGETLHMVYTRGSVCAADDYINKELRIDWADYATLEDLIRYICNYNEDGGFAAIPYTGGDARWTIMADDKELAEVGDNGRIISFCGNDPRTPLRDLKISKLHGKRQ